MQVSHPRTETQKNNGRQSHGRCISNSVDLLCPYSKNIHSAFVHEQAPSDTRVEGSLLLTARLVCQLCLAKEQGSFNDALEANVLSV